MKKLIGFALAGALFAACAHNSSGTLQPTSAPPAAATVPNDPSGNNVAQPDPDQTVKPNPQPIPPPNP